MTAIVFTQFVNGIGNVIRISGQASVNGEQAVLDAVFVCFDLNCFHFVSCLRVVDGSIIMPN